MAVLLVGTLDTKGVEFQFVRDLSTRLVSRTLVLDAGVMGPPHFTPDIPREQRLRRGGNQPRRRSARRRPRPGH